MFDTIVKLNCHSRIRIIRRAAARLLEFYYCCEINCVEIDRSVRFAHHARGCTIAAAKICENVVIYQNVTIGSNMRYNKVARQWENVGNPILCRDVVVGDGAKILGPIIIGEGCVVAAGAIVTRDVPANSVVYGVNRFRPKDPDYAMIFHPDMPSWKEIVAVCQELIVKAQNQGEIP